jgi:hypothetical protein
VSEEMGGGGGRELVDFRQYQIMTAMKFERDEKRHLQDNTKFRHKRQAPWKTTTQTVNKSIPCEVTSRKI